MPHPGVRYFAAVPWVARATIDLHTHFGMLMHLQQRTADLITLVVSQENACRFCYAAVRAALWCQGMDKERIQQVEQDASRADLAPAARAALEYARAQSRSGPAGAHDAWAALRRAGVSAAEAREIAFTVALTDFSNRLYTMPAVPSLPIERMPEQWLVRLLRPLIDRIGRRHRFRGSNTPLPPGTAELAYGRLVAAFAGSPIAPPLARTMQDMFASAHLSRRCKLLIFAVVSRALPCEVCEIEVAQALRREGLDAATLARALTHLDAPELEPIERLLITLVVITVAWLSQRRRGAGLQRQLDAAAEELQRLQHACARLAPAGVVNRLVADGVGGLTDLPAQRKVVTALFADLVGYTAMSERLEPDVLARVLNGYFQRMSNAIHEHSGHVSTFLGDGILAYFGALQPNPWQSADAVRAALAMRDAMADYNRELVDEGLPALGVGIGIHRGAGLVGLIGSRERMEYGFVGRTVNVAARVQALTRTHGVDILVTEAVRAELDTSFALDVMPAEQVKGIAQPVVSYAVRRRIVAHA